ncbi:hypothetical protein HMPREF9944_00556 [Segatella maculosa OT 289]|uniref:Uncharacterized protein n=1 Tax=Segatella maculosa OT 289 TaxID=999422 RepID=H1HK62_9BACT|nr:hypothetical protein HMPREF9944_00556 [Segatella maculosa OT 289]
MVIAPLYLHGQKSSTISIIPFLQPNSTYIFTDKNTALKSNPKDFVFHLRPLRFSVSAVLVFNLSHFAVQFQPFCTVKWAILHDKMAKIETQGSSR